MDATEVTNEQFAGFLQLSRMVRLRA